MDVKKTLLQDAKALIEDPRHWTKGSYESGNTEASYCALGALYKAASNAGVWGIDRYEATAALEDAVADPFLSVISFNDAPETTHADVMAMYDRAIDGL